MNKFKQGGHAAIITVKSLVNNVKDPIETEIKVKRIDFLYSFRPIYYFSRIFGLMPFSIIYDSNGERARRPKITIFDGIWLLISVCTQMLGVYLTIRFKFVNQTSPTFVVILGYTFIIMTVMYGVGAVVMDLCNRFKFLEIINSFTVFDKHVSFFDQFYK